MARMVPAQVYKGLAALALLLSLATTACGASSSERASYAPLNLNLRFDVDRYEFTTPQSMCPSILTSEVVVGSHGQARWNTSSGQRPPIADSKTLIMQGFRIYTPVQFAQNQPLIDHRPAPTREFVMVGGQVGPDHMSIDPFPQLQDGGRYIIVFGPGSLPAGQGNTTNWLVVYSAFPIDGRDMVLLQAAGSPNEPGPGRPQPEIKLSLTDFKQQLAACK